MPNKKINQLTPRTPTLTDLILVGDPATGYSYKATLSVMAAFVAGNIQFSSLGGVSLTSPTNGQYLTFDGVNWVNTTLSTTSWDTAYNRSLTAAAVTGTTTKTLTLTKQDGSTLTASWTDINTITSVFGRTGVVVAAEGDYSLDQLGDVTITTPATNQVLQYNGTTWVNATFVAGINSLNGLTATTQTFAAGTSGTDFAIVSTTSTHTFNLPTASATNRGALSSADWTTFNGKVSGSGTTNYLPKWTGSTALGNSLIQDDGTNVAIGTTPATYKFRVSGNVFSSSYFVGTTTNTSDQFKAGGLLAFASSGTTSYIQIGYNSTLNCGWITALTEGVSYRGIIIANNNQNVGIGSLNAPSSGLEIEKSNFPAISLKKTGTAVWTIGNRTESTGTNFNISYGTTDIFNITSGGNVLIGTTTDAGYKFQVSGSTLLKGSGTTSADWILYAQNSNASKGVFIRNDGWMGFNYSSPLGSENYLFSGFTWLRSATNDNTSYSLQASSPNSANGLFVKGGKFVGIHYSNPLGSENFLVDGLTRLRSSTNDNTSTALQAGSSNGSFGLWVRGDGSTGINTSSPNASALLDVSSTTQGFLPPRMTGAQAEAIGTPAAGLLVYANNGNGTTITTTGWWGYNGSGWVKLN